MLPAWAASTAVAIFGMSFLKMFQLFGDPSGQTRPDHNRSLD